MEINNKKLQSTKTRKEASYMGDMKPDDSLLKKTRNFSFQVQRLYPSHFLNNLESI